MGVSRLTVLEIFTNPADLEFTVGESDGKWGVLISRGAGHRFKPLLSTEAVFPERDTAIDAIRSVLNGAFEEGQRNFPSEPSMLTKELTNKILEKVKESGSCSTSLLAS